MSKKILNTPHLLAAPKARRGLPLWAMVAGALVLLLGLAAVVTPFFIPWDRLKGEATVAASQALGRELGIGPIEVSLFSGVHIKDLRLANAKGGFSDQALFTNADAKVDVSLLSLLTGKLVINSITFIQPHLLIETNAKGVSNLSGLGTQAAPASGTPATSTSRKGSSASARSAGDSAAPAAGATATVGGATFPAVLESLVIQDGDLTLRDRRKGTESAIHGLNVNLQGISLDAAGASRLRVSLDAVLEGKTIPLSLDSSFSLDLAHQGVDIRSMEIKAPALDATLSGTVKDFNKPSVDLAVKGALDLAQLAGLLPPSLLASLPPDLKTKGGLKLELTAQGALARPEAIAVKGSLSFDQVGASYGSYPALGGMDGTMSFDRAGVDLPALNFSLGGDPVSVALKAHWGDLSHISGPTASMKADVSYSVRAHKLNLDPILAISAPDKGAGGAAAAQSASGEGAAASPAAGAGSGARSSGRGLPSYAAQVPRGLSLDGRVDVDSMSADGLTTGKLTQRLLLSRQRLSSTTDLQLYGGRLHERSSVDLSQAGPVFASSLGLDGLDLHALIDDAASSSPNSKLAQLKGKVDGKLSFSADVKGRGLAQPWVLDNTVAKADFEFKDGVIRKTDMQERLASVIPHPQTQQLLRADIKFAEAKGLIQYSARRMTLKSFDLGSGSDWRGGDEYVQASGILDLDKDLDFKIVPHFNPAADNIGGDLGRAFQDDKGWPTYDYIEYSGPSAKEAKASFTAGLKKAASKAVAQHVDQVKQVARQAVQKNAGSLLKKLPGGLNKLFGQ
jgi:AsmA protein